MAKTTKKFAIKMALCMECRQTAALCRQRGNRTNICRLRCPSARQLRRQTDFATRGLRPLAAAGRSKNRAGRIKGEGMRWSWTATHTPATPWSRRCHRRRRCTREPQRKNHSPRSSAWHVGRARHRNRGAGTCHDWRAAIACHHVHRHGSGHRRRAVAGLPPRLRRSGSTGAALRPRAQGCPHPRPTPENRSRQPAPDVAGQRPRSKDPQAALWP